MKNVKELLAENKQWIEETFAKVDAKMSVVTKRSAEKIVDGVDANGVHKVVGPNAWTAGFWGGLNYLLYNYTKNEDYLTTARNIEAQMDKGLANFEALHHDVGFMWHILSGANYQICGDAKSKVRNLFAASSLMSRFVLSGGFIRAWNQPWQGGDVTNWTIIDCMMNLPILYWASEQLDDTRFKKIAIRHADMTMRDHIRPDGSVNHIVVHDPDQPDTVLGTKGGQGYGIGSCWSRGASWALYGFVLSYIHTGDVKYLDTAKKVAHYFIMNLEMSDWKALCDFRAPEEPVIYDSSAAAIAACGMIEIAKNVPEYEKDIYLNAAIKTLKALDEHFCDYGEDEDSIVLKGTGMYTASHHIPLVYADMFYAEALLKLKGSKFLMW